MVKTTINNEWKKYIHRQIKLGVNKKKLEDVLKKQNYSCDIINEILYSNEIETNNCDYKVSYSTDPIVETYPHFLSDEECEYFINISKKKI